MKQKILLVGANGYIGSQLYKKLKHKFDIYPIDNFFRKTKKQKFVKKKRLQGLKNKFFEKIFLLCMAIRPLLCTTVCSRSFWRY